MPRDFAVICRVPLLLVAMKSGATFEVEVGEVVMIGTCGEMFAAGSRAGLFQPDEMRMPLPATMSGAALVQTVECPLAVMFS